jgi:hypothetical protein
LSLLGFLHCRPNIEVAAYLLVSRQSYDHHFRRACRFKLRSRRRNWFLILQLHFQRSKYQLQTMGNITSFFYPDILKLGIDLRCANDQQKVRAGWVGEHQGLQLERNVSCARPTMH